MEVFCKITTLIISELHGGIIPRRTTYDLVRKYIIDNTSITQIVDLGSGIFEKVTASTIILQLNNLIRTDNEVTVLTQVHDFSLRLFDTSIIHQNQFLKNISYAFNIFGNNVVCRILQEIEHNCYHLGNICSYISPGIDGDKNKYVSDNMASEQYKPLLYGKNIKRYAIQFDDNYILYDKKLLNRSRNEIIYLTPKIITQRISGGTKPIIAAIDYNQFYTFNSVNNIILKDKTIGLKNVVALLNSNIINWYYANNFSNNSTLTVNISKTYLEKLPIPEISKEIENQLNDLVNIIMEKKSIDSNTDTSKEEQEIDLIVYKLYGLTYDEVKVVDSETSITEEEYEAMDD